MALSLEDASTFLPKYLSPASRAELFGELSRLPETHSYYAAGSDQAILQGDGWDNVQFVDPEDRAKRQIRVVVVSNTCDIAPENPRDVPIRVLVSPLIRVSRFVELLRRNKVDDKVIEDKLQQARRQEVSNVFFLPKNTELGEDHLVFFDNVQAQVPSRFFGNTDKRRLFSLSQAGFWYFLLKLSIHFCRANEGVVRGPGK